MQLIFWWIIAGVLVFRWCQTDPKDRVLSRMGECALVSLGTLAFFGFVYIVWSIIASLPHPLIEPIHFKWPF